MKKKLTAIFLCIALVAIAIVGASMAYFTDTKEATNTFTVGNVKIDLIESRYHRVGMENSGDTSIPDPTTTVSDMKYVDNNTKAFTDAEIKEDAENYANYIGTRGQNMVPGRGVAKCPYVVNTGNNDAYIRIRVMVPTAANNDYVKVEKGGVITNQWCSTATISGEFQHGSNGENWPVITKEGYTDEKGLKYDVYTFTRIEPLKAGDMTEWNVWNYIGIDKTANSADIQKAIEKGAMIKGPNGTGMTLNVLVQADAIQAEGFENAAAAWTAFAAQN